MTKQEFKTTIFVLSEQLYPMVSRILGSTRNTEDAMQDIMLKLWQKRHQLKKHPNIKGFVFLTARNYCLDLLRKKTLHTKHTKKHLNTVPSKNSNSLEWQELNTIVLHILETIPKQQKEVFLMRDIDGFEFSEIAVVLDIKVTHARVLLSRARQHIGNILLKTYNYEKGTY